MPFLVTGTFPDLSIQHPGPLDHWGWVNVQPLRKAHSALLPGLARPAGAVARLRSNGALSKPYRLPGRYRSSWDAAHTP